MSLETLKAEYEATPREQRQGVLRKIYAGLSNAPKPELDDALRVLLPLMNVASPNEAADVALTLGALIEAGADAEPLANAILAPLRTWLTAAARFAARAAELDEAEADAPEDEAIDLGPRRVPRADIDELHAHDPEAVASWFSLEVWFRPAVASLTRCPAALRVARNDDALRAALSELAPLPGGAYWLRILFDACAHDRLVFLLPELKQAFELTADGLVDAGQLTVLLSAVLEAPLKELGASGPASAEVMKTMLGAGPQQVQGASYASQFYLYPWRSMNPQTRLPEDDRYWWTAPGGQGSMSLPADFQPATLELLEGARVLFLVGPKLPSLTHRFVRQIGASRMFDHLQARLSEPVALGTEGFDTWMARIVAALAAPTA